jgi:hypothetical protein
MNETELTKKIVAAIRREYLGAYVRKNHGNVYQVRGRPDLEVLWQGINIWLEVKVPGKVASPSQAAEGREIGRARGAWYVVDSVVGALQACADQFS